MPFPFVNDRNYCGQWVALVLLPTAIYLNKRIMCEFSGSGGEYQHVWMNANTMCITYAPCIKTMQNKKNAGKNTSATEVFISTNGGELCDVHTKTENLPCRICTENVKALV